MCLYISIPSDSIEFINFHLSPAVYDRSERVDNMIRVYVVDNDEEYIDWFETPYPFDKEEFISDFLEYLDSA